MSRIILDMSANTHKNDIRYIYRMIDEIKAIDTGKHEIIFKHQLFVKAGENIPLERKAFDMAYRYAKERGYKTTSSVFDVPSLNFLLSYNPCFVKMANNRSLNYLIGEIPRKIPVYKSVGTWMDFMDSAEMPLCCVSEYPASLKDYETNFKNYLMNAVSDHTINFDLWHKYKPEIIEWHYVLEHDPNNLDGGLFARTPAMLAEVL